MRKPAPFSCNRSGLTIKPQAVESMHGIDDLLTHQQAIEKEQLVEISFLCKKSTPKNQLDSN